MKMTIDTADGQSGCRQFRHQESAEGGEYYYSAWYYLPRQVDVKTFARALLAGFADDLPGLSIAVALADTGRVLTVHEPILFDSPQRKRLDRAIRSGHKTIDHSWFKEPLRFQIVHEIVGVVRSGMTGAAQSFAKEDILSSNFRWSRFGRVQFAVDSEFRSRRKIEKRLKLAHEMNLTSTFQDIDALLCRCSWIAIKIGGALFELREIFNALQGAL